MNDIFERLKVDFQYITGFVYKGLVASIGLGFASRLEEFASKLGFIEKQAFISTADKEYLYLKTGRLLPPKPALTAGGFVVFYGVSGTIIPQGTELKDDNGTFKTLSEATITQNTKVGTVTVTGSIAVFTYNSHELTNTQGLVNGVTTQITVIDANTLQFDAGTLITGDTVTLVTENTAVVSVVAEASGIIGNRILNDVLQLKVTIGGVNKDLGVILIDGGKDEESVEDYRKRVEFFIINPQSPFNDNNIKYINMENIKTLKYIWVESPIEGTIKAVALNESFGLTSQEQADIIQYTKSIAPAQMDITAITVALPTVTDIQVVISSLSPASDGLKTEVEKNIRYLYEVDMYEKGISASQLEAVIYKTTNGAEQVDSFTLVSGSTTATSGTFWKYTGTTFQ